MAELMIVGRLSGNEADGARLGMKVSVANGSTFGDPRSDGEGPADGDGELKLTAIGAALTSTFMATKTTTTHRPKTPTTGNASKARENREGRRDLIPRVCGTGPRRASEQEAV
jgi:hypothetical protein